MSDTKEAELSVSLKELVRHESQKLHWQILAAYFICTGVMLFFVLSLASIISWQASLMILSLCIYGAATHHMNQQKRAHELAAQEALRLEAEAEKRKNDDLYSEHYIPVHQTHALVRDLLVKRFQKHYLGF